MQAIDKRNTIEKIDVIVVRRYFQQRKQKYNTTHAIFWLKKLKIRVRRRQQRNVNNRRVDNDVSVDNDVNVDKINYVNILDNM